MAGLLYSAYQKFYSALINFDRFDKLDIAGNDSSIIESIVSNIFSFKVLTLHLYNLGLSPQG